MSLDDVRELLQSVGMLVLSISVLVLWLDRGRD